MRCRSPSPGFALIVKEYDYVRIDPEMIGLTPDGKVKVWLNAKYSKNEPEPHSLLTLDHIE